MMYYYSEQFTLLKKIFKKKNITKVNINFSIPRVKKKSFRKENKLESSILFDMGCYPFSLLSYFGFKNRNYRVFFKKNIGKLIELHIFFQSKKIEFNIIIAVNKSYKNYINITFKNDTSYRFNHFFYGKKIQKTNYFYNSNKKIKLYKIKEKNLFRNIFNFSYNKLLKLSNFQYIIIKNYLTSLNQIKKKIKL